MRARAAACLLAAVAAVAAAACGKKSGDGAPSAELAGLAAVPANAEVVIGVDLAKVAGAPLVQRAVDQLLLRDADLQTRWQRFHDSCKLDLGNQIRRMWLAIGPSGGGGSGAPSGRPGTGPTVMVVTGQLGEADLSTCVRAMVGQGGGSLTAKDLSGRTLYQAKDGSRSMFFAFGRADTVVLGANEAYVTEALGTGTKVLDDADMKRFLAQADQTAAVWAAGRVDPRVRAGLASVTQGKLTAGPVAFVAALDFSDGAKVELGAVMPTAADAKALESFAKTELGTLGMVAQIRSMQRIVDKIEVKTDDVMVKFTAKLSVDDVNQLLSVLDGGPAPAQGSAPSGP
jgi:hypothetical protein